jgi:chromosome segregation ATPase
MNTSDINFIQIQLMNYVQQISILMNKISVLEKELDERYTETKNQFITIKQKDEEITLLKQQNVDLISEIKLLKNERDELKLKIEKLEITINQQNTSINEQNKCIEKLQKCIDNLQDKEIINKYIIVIQYLNSIYKLEKNIKNTRIAYLRDDRNYDCHYILDTDKDYIKLKKTEYILDKLSTIDEHIKYKIEKKYGKDIIQNIISVVKPFVETDKTVNNTGFTQERIDDEITFFWED